MRSCVIALSELESGLARGVGQCLDAARVDEAVAVEGDLADLPRERGARDLGADLLGGVDVLGRLESLAHLGRARRRARQRAPARRVDELRVDVLAAAVDQQLGALAVSDLLARLLLAPQPQPTPFDRRHL